MGGGCGTDVAGGQRRHRHATNQLLACCMLFIAVLVRISEWCLQSGSAYHPPPSFIPFLCGLLMQTLYQTPSDIHFSTRLPSFIHPHPPIPALLASFVPRSFSTTTTQFLLLRFHSFFSWLSPDHRCISVIFLVSPGWEKVGGKRVEVTSKQQEQTPAAETPYELH